MNNALFCLDKSGAISIAPPDTPADVRAWFSGISVEVKTDDTESVSGFVCYTKGADIIRYSQFNIETASQELRGAIVRQTAESRIFGIKFIE